MHSGRWKFGVVLLSGCLLVAALAIVGWRTFGEAAWQPTIACAQPEINLGQIEPTSVYRTHFVLQNIGWQDLVVTRILAGCSKCVTVEPTSGRIAPGESLKVTAQLDPRGLSGEQRKFILVESNDAKQPKVRLALRCFVKRDLLARPDTVRLQRDGSGNWITQAVDVIARDDQVHFQVMDIVPPVPDVSVKWEPLADQNGYRLFIAASPSLGDKPLRKYLIIKTDHQIDSEIRVPVFANL